MTEQDKQTGETGGKDAVEAAKPATDTPGADQTAPQKPAKKKRSHASNPQHRQRSLLVGLILLLAGICAVLGWMNLDSRDRLAALESGLQTLKSGTGDLDQRLQQAGKQLSDTSGRLDADSQQFQASLQSQQQELNQLKENLITLQEQRSSSNAWKLAELEYLLEVANLSLSLQRDPATALAALKAADDRLRRLGDPRLNDVRAKVNREIQALEGVAELDLMGMVMELSAMEESVDKLPLFPESKFVFAPGNQESAAADQAEPAAGPEGWLSLLGKVWGDINNWVDWRRTDEPVQPLLPPDQSFFLLQNLKLKLGAVRLSILRGDDRNFHALLDETETWLLEYFDSDQPAVAAMIAALGKYKATTLSRPLPDISGSLTTLRAWRRQRKDG